MKTLFTLLFCALAFAGFAQQNFIISGHLQDVNGNDVRFAAVQIKVTNAPSGSPMDGYITSNSSDGNGNYSFVIPNGSDTNYNYSYMVLVYQCMTVDSGLVHTQNGTITQAIQNFTSTCSNGSCSISYTVAPQTSDTIYLFASINTTSTTGTAVSWNFGDGTSGSGWYPTHTYAQNGTYAVCVTFYDSLNACYDNFCDSITDSFKAPGFVLQVLPPQTVSINENEAASFSLFPNPAANVINIGANGFEESYSVSVFDITGKSIMERSRLNGNSNLDISSISPGVYFIQARDEHGAIIYSEKFMKK